MRGRWAAAGDLRYGFRDASWDHLCGGEGGDADRDWVLCVGGGIEGETAEMSEVKLREILRAERQAQERVGEAHEEAARIRKEAAEEAALVEKETAERMEATRREMLEGAEVEMKAAREKVVEEARGEIDRWQARYDEKRGEIVELAGRIVRGQ